MLPPNVAVAVLVTPQAQRPTSVFATEKRMCEGAAFHSPSPLLLKRVCIDGSSNGFSTWAIDSEDEYEWPFSAWLCGTCEGNLFVYVTLLSAAGGDLEWKVRREFGNRLRALGNRAWQSVSEHA